MVRLVTYLVDIGMRLGGWVSCLEVIGMCLGGRGERLSGRGPCRMGIWLGGRVPYFGLVCSASLPGGAAGEDRKGMSGGVWNVGSIMWNVMCGGSIGRDGQLELNSCGYTIT